MLRQSLPAFASCLALILYALVGFQVARMRGKHRIMAPATTGAPEFERAYRVQMNTLEQLALFLPSLWLFAFLVSPFWAGVLGLVWVAARAFYAWSYVRDPATRGPGFVVAMVTTLVLLIGALVGSIVAMSRTGLFG